MTTAGWTIRWKKIIAVIDANFAVAKRKPEKNSGLYGIRSCTGIAEVKGSNPVPAWIFFKLSFRNCESCVYNCDGLLSYNCFNFAREKKRRKRPNFPGDAERAITKWAEAKYLKEEKKSNNTNFSRRKAFFITPENRNKGLKTYQRNEIKWDPISFTQPMTSFLFFSHLR